MERKQPQVKAAFFGGRDIYGQRSQIDYVYGPERKRRIAELTDLYPYEIHQDNLEQLREMPELEVAFATWGMPLLDDAVLDWVLACVLSFMQRARCAALPSPCSGAVSS